MVWVSALRDASQRKLEDFYEVMGIIGEGGFAKVRLGRCLHTHEKRAIKTMNKAEAHAKVLGTEVAIIKRVDHPNIVKTFDVFETTEQIHIVMEFMEGGMLYDSIEDGVQFDEADVVQFMRELLDGVLYLHDIGIVHRDIKPENVLCTSKKAPLHVKIADFGLSSISTVADMKENRMLMSTMIGTPEFVAPEIARQETYTEKVDMWALGMLCYNVIARRLPLDDDRDMIAQIQQGIILNFPEPEWQRFSEHARSFVRSLLCPEAERRLSPLGCLVHRWVETVIPEQSTKFAAHGRMSNILFAPNTQQLKIMNKHRHLNSRKQWKKLFLVVNAMCKLTNCCGALKMFGTAKLRAISMMMMDRNSTTVGTSYAESNDSSRHDLSGQMRPASAATSNSTNNGEDELNYNTDANRVTALDNQAKAGDSRSKSARFKLDNNGSADLDLAFDEMDIADGDIDIPKSFNSNDGVATAMAEVASLKGVLRFPAFGKKGKGGTGGPSHAMAGVPSNSSGPRTDTTEIKVVRKMVGRKMGVVRGVRISGAGSHESHGHKPHGRQEKDENQANPHDSTGYGDAEEGMASFATTSGVLTKPWRSSMTKNKTEHYETYVPKAPGPHGEMGLVASASQPALTKGTTHSKTSLRKRILHTLTGSGSNDSRSSGSKGSSNNIRKHGHGPKAMSKLTRMIRGKGEHSSRAHGHRSEHVWDEAGEEYEHGEHGPSIQSGFAGKGNGRSMTVLGLACDYESDSTNGDRKYAGADRKTGELERDEQDRAAENGVKTFDAAHLQNMYGRQLNNEAPQSQHSVKGGSGKSKLRKREKNKGKVGGSNHEDSMTNRMSPLTPSTDATGNPAFKK